MLVSLGDELFWRRKSPKCMGERKQKAYVVGKKCVFIDPSVCHICMLYIKSAVSQEFQYPGSGHQSAFN